MKKGTRIWICDACGKRETWRKGWFYLWGIKSAANKPDKEGNAFPVVFCSDACEDVGLRALVVVSP